LNNQSFAGKTFFPDWAKRLVGRAMVLFIGAASLFLAKGTARRHAQAQVSGELDRTGILVSHPETPTVMWKDASVIFPFYEESLAHSFWRAQEFSLFMQNRALLRPPLLDFGCGDGSFAAVLFEKIDYGVDIDADALKTAGKFGLYSELVQSVGNRIPLPDGGVNSIMSNSVLEHVQGLEDVIGELSRILAVNGSLVFTVPIAQLTRDLQKYFGGAEAVKVNQDCFHRNLLEVGEWQDLLGRHGLAVTVLQMYQPDWFTFYYWAFRFLGNRGLGRFFPAIRRTFFRRFRGNLVGMIRSSIRENNVSGGNILVVARKLPR
jgi:SAM-dependent methyltransferase